MSRSQSPHSQVRHGGSSSASPPPSRCQPESRSSVFLPQPPPLLVTQSQSRIPPFAAAHLLCHLPGCSSSLLLQWEEQDGEKPFRLLFLFTETRGIKVQAEIRMQSWLEVPDGLLHFVSEHRVWQKQTICASVRVLLRQIWGFWSNLNRKLIYHIFNQQSWGKRIEQKCSRKSQIAVFVTFELHSFSFVSINISKSLISTLVLGILSSFVFSDILI